MSTTPVSSHPPSVKSLRNRWELSSATGTPLHPDDNEDELLAAASRLLQQKRKPSPSINSGIASKINSPITKRNRDQADNTDKQKNSLIEELKFKCLKRENEMLIMQKERDQICQVSIDSIFMPCEMRPSQALAFCPSNDYFHENQETIDSASVNNENPTENPGQNADQKENNFIQESEFKRLDEMIFGQQDEICQPAFCPENNYFYETQETIDSASLNNEDEDSADNTDQKENNLIQESELKHLDELIVVQQDQISQGSQALAFCPQNNHFHETQKTIDSASFNEDPADNTNQKENNLIQESEFKRLNEMIIVQQDQICQASRALAFCRQNEHFRGTREEVDAQRALLISTERRRALLKERDHMLNGSFCMHEDEPKGTLTISSISIKLSKEYIENFVHHNSVTSSYYFIVLIKTGGNLFHTSLALSTDCIRSGYIEFAHPIPITGLSPDFICELEVYSLKTNNDGKDMGHGGRSFNKKGTWRRMVISTPLNAYSHTFNGYSAGNANRPIGVMDPGFQRIGIAAITRQMIGHRKLKLTDVVYPIEGYCLLDMDCHPDPNSTKLREHRIFLSLYQIVGGLGSWCRFWCVLANGHLNFWRYPEDEETKDPVVTLDLSWCVTPFTVVSSSTASFPNSMQVDVIVPSNTEADHKEGVRMLFAADTIEEKNYWLNAINKAIRNSNIWRSVKQQQRKG